jgi:hypothetical protein
MKNPRREGDTVWDNINRDLALFRRLRHQSYKLFPRILGNEEFWIILWSHPTPAL